MKAPDQPHFIQRFKFDFEIDSKDDAHRLHTDLSRIFNSRIKAILDEVMSDLDDPSHIIRIPELVIDLGEIYEGSMEKEVVMRFETVFRRELTLRLGELRHGRAAISSDKGQKVSIVPARLEIVAYFLVNGRLPAGAEQMAGKVEQLILELLETNPPNVVRMLKTVARKPAALKRLSSSFSEKLIGKVYAAIVSENAMSIASIEKKLIADAAKVLKTPQAVLTMEVRQAVLRYLLVDPPAIFDRRKFQAAVTLDVQKVFGKEATTAFGDLDERQEAFASQNEQRARRQAALEVLERYIKGSVPAESPLAIAEAWEYLVKNEAPSLRKMLAAKSVKIAAITSLVQVLSPSAMRDFVEKIVPSSPMQLIHVAASVVSAYSLHRKGAAAEKQFAAEVYAVLVQQLALNPSVTPTASQLAAAIKAHLGRLPDAPKQLLKEWNKLELPGVTTPESRRKQKAEQTAKDSQAQKEFEAKVAELKSRTKQSPDETVSAEGEEGEDELQEGPDSPKGKSRTGKSKTGKTKAGTDKESADKEDETVERKDKKQELEDDETFFKRYREQLSQRAAGIAFEELPTGDEEALAPSIDSPEGRIELVLQMIVNGSRPWWAESMSAIQLEIYFKALIAKHPEVVKAAFARLVRTIPTARYAEVVNRLISTVNETTLSNLLAVLAPEISGFVTTVSLALTAWLETEKDSLSIPAHLAEPSHFIWHAPLKYIFEYMTGGFSAGQMVRYVLKELSKALGISSRDTIVQMNAIADAAIAKGEKRFNAFKGMIPKTFEGLQVAAPTPHEPADQVWTKFEALEQAAVNRGIEKAAEPEEKQEPAERLSPEEKFLLERLQKGRKKDPKSGQESTPETGQDSKEPAVEGEPDSPVEKGTEIPAIEDQPALTVAEREALKAEEERKAEAEKAAAHEKAAQTTPEDAAQPEVRGPQDRPQRKTNLTQAEQEAEESIVLEVIQQYLEHGSLSAAATAYFTPATFKGLLLGTFGIGSKPLIHMLRSSMVKSGARLRVIGMGDEVALRVTGLLQTLIASKMQPFVEEMLRLFGSASAPVSRVHVLDHAMRFAMQATGSSFVPLHYVRDFVEYVAGQPGRNVREVLIWANKRLESSSTPLKESMLEMLDIVERIDQSQNQGKRKAAAATPSAPVMIKAPDGDIYVTNAGAGIVHIIFAQLFKAFNLLTEDKMAFVSREAASRAAHYIQYLTDKELDAPEEKMVFNKLLVGLPLEQPLEPLAEPLTQDEIDTCEYVMQTLCEKWSVMKSAGPDYMRTTFLMREGRLRSNGDGWIIRVEQTGLDILKNKIPWATNPIRLPWLTYLIDVDWP